MQSAGASIPPWKPRRREPGTKRGTPTAPTQACSHLPAAQGPRPASLHGRLVPHPVRVQGQVPQGFQDDSGAPGARESLCCLAHVFTSEVLGETEVAPASQVTRLRWPHVPGVSPGLIPPLLACGCCPPDNSQSSLLVSGPPEPPSPSHHIPKPEHEPHRAFPLLKTFTVY